MILTKQGDTSEMNEEEADCAVWRTGFGRDSEPVLSKME
jgi:hypothetical protein